MELGPISSSDSLQKANSQLEKLARGSTSTQIRNAAAYLKSNLSDKTTQASFAELLEQISELIASVTKKEESTEFTQVVNQIMKTLPLSAPQDKSKCLLNAYQSKRDPSQQSLSHSEDRKYKESENLLGTNANKEKERCSMM